MTDTTLTSNERCPDCGREKWQHTPVEDFPCGVRISKELSLIQRLKNLGQGGFDLDFDALDQVTPEARRQCMEAELLANEAACALEESHRLFGALTGTGPAHETEAGAPVCIEVGNWYSEYECPRCKVKWVQNDDAPTHKHTCAPTQKAKAETSDVRTVWEKARDAINEAIRQAPDTNRRVLAVNALHEIAEAMRGTPCTDTPAQKAGAGE